MNTPEKPSLFEDLRGVRCPMNLVKVKVAFAKIQSGELLEVVLDDGPPINNVPDSAEREGHTVLVKKQLEDGAWSVVLKKA